MSWGIKIGGSKAAVTDQIQRDTNLPCGLKSDLLGQVAELQLAPNEVVLLESGGHVDSSYGGQGSFKIEKLTLAPDGTLPSENPPTTAAQSA